MKNKIKPISELKKCPYCGNEDEWYRKQSYKGNCEYRERFDGDEADNSNLEDGTTYKDTSKFAYCGDCHKKIALLD